MIFGFNTDVKHGDTIYHVQSEARESELLLQTQVFVRGRCIGKRATSYAETGSQPAIYRPAKRAGPARPAPPGARRHPRRATGRHSRPQRTPEALAAVKELEVQWLNADSVHADRNLTMQLRVTEGGTAVAGARLTFRFARPDAAPFYTQVVTDSGGAAEMKIEVEESALPDSSVLVQANFAAAPPPESFVCARSVRSAGLADKSVRATRFGF